MNDKRLIYAEDAIDALRYTQHRFTVADEAGGIGTVKWSENVIYFAAAENALANLPSAQPVIIRCKDCIDYPTDGETGYSHRRYCPTTRLVMPEDGFCCYAERRIDETD